MNYGGVDTHRRNLSAGIVDDVGRAVGTVDVPNTRPGIAKLVEWFAQHDVERIGVEGSGSTGRLLACTLIAAGFDTSEVPATRTFRERGREPGKGKTDLVDAVIVARVCAADENLPSVKVDQQAYDLRLLIERRDELVQERTAQINRVHSALVILMPGSKQPMRTIPQVRAIARKLCRDRSIQAEITRQRLKQIVAIWNEADELQRQIDLLLEQRSCERTRAIHGVGTIVCAELVAQIADIRRYRSRHAFARANGTAPIPASSGQTVRVRLNRGGNRQINKLLHRIAVVQLRRHEPARQYYARKKAEGKSNTEALRCLKRRISDTVYRAMQADAAAGSPSA
ncbi:MAG: IS110 family transposase [Gammaproteobacteria bacterium]|nr:IS110 family transposase [Gammaproteobacteria bacterium]